MPGSCRATEDVRRAAFFASLTSLALAVLVAAVPSVRSAEGSGTFAVITDLHFDPFDPPQLAAALVASAPAAWPAILASANDQAMSRTGEDTNHALLASSLAIFAKAAASADFALVPGDLLAHGFEEKAAKALGVALTSQAVADMAVKTTIFVGDALAGALGGKPAIIALGNNDSHCGDYRIEPGGSYLAATREAVRRLAGAGHLEPDFDETYAAGGYYAMRHPTVADMLIVVLNDVLWSTKYRDACGTDGFAAAQAMFDWLRDRLARQRAAGGRVWIVHHIPWGIDAYSTVDAKASSCPAKVVPFLKEPFASEFLALLAEYRDMLQASFSGHTHFDDYRLLIDARGTVIGLDKVTPAISPVFGQNPGFQLFTYDRGSGAPRDFSTWYLANPGAAPRAADWQLEYTFTKAYGQPAYSRDTVNTVWMAMSNDRAVQDTYRRLYNVGRGALDAARFTAYSCAMGHMDRQSFTACYCGGAR
jgi:sphingomyelin phosphodiesterase acid-like 3